MYCNEKSPMRGGIRTGESVRLWEDCGAAAPADVTL